MSNKKQGMLSFEPVRFGSLMNVRSKRLTAHGQQLTAAVIEANAFDIPCLPAEALAEAGSSVLCSIFSSSLLT
jgi:hypothetical protein